MSFLFKDKNGVELSISDSIKEPHKTAHIAISTPESAKLLASFEDMPRGLGLEQFKWLGKCGRNFKETQSYLA